jgi:hypothetical protein
VAASLSRRGRKVCGKQGALRIGWAIQAAAHRLPLPLSCLRRAFAAAWMLQIRGLTPKLHYGIAKAPDGSFKSHGWIEVDGWPVVGHEVADAFTLLTVFPLKDQKP